MTPFWRQISSEYDRYGTKTRSLHNPYRRLSVATAIQPLDPFG